MINIGGNIQIGGNVVVGNTTVDLTEYYVTNSTDIQLVTEDDIALIE